jgi:hypothetical protein
MTSTISYQIEYNEETEGYVVYVFETLHATTGDAVVIASPSRTPTRRRPRLPPGRRRTRCRARSFVTRRESYPDHCDDHRQNDQAGHRFDPFATGRSAYQLNALAQAVSEPWAAM